MKTITFNLSGEIPSKKNSKALVPRKGGGFNIFPGKVYQKWHPQALKQIIAQKYNYVGNFPIEKCSYVKVYLYFGTRRESDCTNKAESIHDLLVDAGILLDDTWQITGPTTQIPEYKKNEGGAFIEIGVL